MKRIGDAERDAAIATLNEHFAAGRLSQGEHTERVQLALEARLQSQLDDLLDDLPDLDPDGNPVPAASLDRRNFTFLDVVRVPIVRWAMVLAALGLTVISRGELVFVLVAAVLLAYWAGRRSG